MTLVQAQQIFSPEFLQQLDEIVINGNFGDLVMNPESSDIVDYFIESNPDIKILISTNAGARDRKFWTQLAKKQIRVLFCIDGLENTHHLYRQNTLYTTVIKNAQTFIQAGGYAIWKMIEFDFNQHEREQAQELSKQMGFKEFKLINWGRNTAPVFNQHKQLTHVIGQPKETSFEILWQSRKTDDVLLEDIVNQRTPAPIDCQIKRDKSVYISSTGDVYPCCYLGFNPKTYGHSNYHQVANAQFKNLIKENNALEHSLADCIKWFAEIEKSWSIPTFNAGRLVICNDVCGRKE